MCPGIRLPLMTRDGSVPGADGTGLPVPGVAVRGRAAADAEAVNHALETRDPWSAR
jgi:hypothetical protein